MVIVIYEIIALLFSFSDSLQASDSDSFDFILATIAYDRHENF